MNTMANGHGGVRPGSGRPRKDGKEREEFTGEQLMELLSSPHIAFVTKKNVSYTVEFKEMFWQRYMDGIEPMQIFRDAGLNTDLLGRNRVTGFVKHLRTLKEKGLPFNDGNTPHHNQPPKQHSVPPRRPKNSNPVILSDDEISKMFHKMKFMEQELEYIKKIILAGRDTK